MPTRTTNLSLALNAPGLVRVDAARFLQREMKAAEKYERLPERYVPDAVDAANITVTLRMLQDLWPALNHAAWDLLAAEYERDRHEYRCLRRSLARLSQPPESLGAAHRGWQHYRDLAVQWRWTVVEYLREARSKLDVDWNRNLKEVDWYRPQEKRIQDRTPPGGPPPLMIGLETAPTFEQLVELDRNLPLPLLLHKIDIATNATFQSRLMQALPFSHRPLLGGKYLDNGAGCTGISLCSRRETFRVVMEGRCEDVSRLLFFRSEIRLWLSKV
ncbi:hypothetical protein VTK26DRAFT_8544 [Humicola hyalothermophila]